MLSSAPELPPLTSGFGTDVVFATFCADQGLDGCGLDVGARQRDGAECELLLLPGPSFPLRSGRRGHFQIHPMGDRAQRREGPRLGTFQAVQGSAELR